MNQIAIEGVEIQLQSNGTGSWNIEFLGYFLTFTQGNMLFWQNSNVSLKTFMFKNVFS